MKIVRLQTENVKRIQAVEITPKGTLVQITGKNEAGKSSILDSIEMALSDARAIPDVPIRRGADKGRIVVDLGDMVVRRSFTAKGSTLVIESADGARYPSPQKIIDAMVGRLTLDPIAFAGMKPADQYDVLKTIVPLEVDVEHLDQLNAGDFARRTDINRDAASARAQAAGILLPADPGETVDTAALAADLEAAGTHNTAIETRKTRRAEVAGQVAQHRTEATGVRADAEAHRAMAERLRREAAEADERAASNDTAAQEIDALADALQKKLDDAPPLPEPIDTSAIRLKIGAAEAQNQAVATYRLRKEAKEKGEARAAELEAESQRLTEAMDARKEVKRKAIAEARMPVPGLSFGDKAVLYDGVPFDQASTAAKIKVSMAIAIAQNPKVRVILIREGSMLDDDNLALVAKVAEDNNMQVWLERTDSSGKVGVVIEDGMVKADNQVPAEQAAEQKDLGV